MTRHANKQSHRNKNLSPLTESEPCPLDVLSLHGITDELLGAWAGNKIKSVTISWLIRRYFYFSNIYKGNQPPC